MSAITVEMPDAICEHIQKLAERENVPVDHLITLAVAEKISALESDGGFDRPVAKEDREVYLDLLTRFATAPPKSDDVIP